MTDFTHMSSVSVQGSVYSAAQGKLIGSFDTMPVASALNNGQIVLYTGPTGTYIKGTYYVSNGTAWVKSDATPERITIDSELSPSSANPVQNSAVHSALNGKLGKTETAARATADANGKDIPTTYLTQSAASATYVTKSDLSANYATKGDLTSAITSVYRYQGSVTNFSDLPSNPTKGDVYNVENANGNVPAGTNWAWNGTSWDALAGSVDLSGYVPTSRKVNNKALTGDIALSAADVGAVSTTGTAARATADANGANIANTYATIQTVNGKQDKLTATGSATKPIYINSNGIPTAISYTLADACAKSVTDAVTQNSTALITSGAVYSGLASKQNKLTFDSTPTSGSSNPVTSGGVYSAINALRNSVVDIVLEGLSSAEGGSF